MELIGLYKEVQQFLDKCTQSSSDYDSTQQPFCIKNDIKNNIKISSIECNTPNVNKILDNVSIF